jgi:hypothetical protein
VGWGGAPQDIPLSAQRGNVIQEKPAKEIGVTIPQSVLYRAAGGDRRNDREKTELREALRVATRGGMHRFARGHNE